MLPGLDQISKENENKRDVWKMLVGGSKGGKYKVRPGRHIFLLRHCCDYHMHDSYLKACNP